MNETRPGGPTVLRMILGRQLQALREKAGMSYDEAAEVIYTSSATVRRMERAEGALKPLNVKSLLMAYGITDVREVDAFLALARDASRPGWWHSYDDVLPSWFRTLIGLEEAASLIRGFDPHSVPGLLQTRGYARANVQTGFPDAAEDEVMREQVDKLIEAAARPSITLQVLPLAAGLHPAVYGPFKVFRFDGHDQPDIVYGESMTSAWYIDKPDETAAYIQALDRVSAQAAPAADTVKILTEIRKEL